MRQNESLMMYSMKANAQAVVGMLIGGGYDYVALLGTDDVEASAAIVMNEEDKDIHGDDNDEDAEHVDEPGDEARIGEGDNELQQDIDMVDNDETDEQEQVEQADNDMQRDPTMLTGYPQKGAVYTPGSLNGLWTGRMIIPSETHLRALLLPPAPLADQQGPLPPVNEPPAAAVPHDHPPLPDNIDNGNENAAPHPPHNANPTNHPLQEAGHRPNPFTETTLGLVAVPLYVRLSEYAMYAGGNPIPCANDTDNGDKDETSRPDGSNGVNVNRDDTFDQGIQDAWFPPNTTLSAKGDHVVVSVPSSVLTSREEGKYEYVAVRNNDEDAKSSLGFGMGSEAEARNKRKPGTFHDRETCTGCIAREKALVAARAQARGMNVETENPVGEPLSSNEESESLQEDETINDLPPYVPSAETLPPCNGIRDVLITGNTDPRHAAAWGNWVWKGRVRKWDGMVGLVRSANNGSNGISTGNGGGGKIFLYGTILRGRNLVGTWRLAHEDPRMPAYEGAFTLGRKDE
ncbi:hypothetical protein GGU10DRAFT_19571 [Lentinula aff. detonsa]|uniref:Uncharacterized protein n=1 Tax=Lentinula aff. detonsa TaxID=2804958 RepID=A0AA38NLK9_9AGAR|nr:hypothetical protein GGU10DRAFT_19571 [Lentinula aff. detonsa]